MRSAKARPLFLGVSFLFLCGLALGEKRLYTYSPEEGDRAKYKITAKLNSKRVDKEDEGVAHEVFLEATVMQTVKKKSGNEILSDAKVLDGTASQDGESRKLPFKGHVFGLKISGVGRVLEVLNAEEVDGVDPGEVNWQGVFQQGQPIFPEEAVGPGSKWSVQQVANLPESLYRGKILQAEYTIENVLMEEGKQSLNIHVDYWVLKDANDLSEAFKIGQGRTVCDVATGRLVRSEAWFNGQVSETQEMVRGGQIVSEEWIYMVDVYTGVERAE